MAVSEKKRQQILGDAAGVLVDGEDVVDVTTCLAEVKRMGQKSARRATLLVTDRRVVIYSKKLGGYDVQDFAYGLLTSVDHKKGMMFGNIDLRAAGDGTTLSQVPKEEVERVAQAIRQRMALAHAPAAPPAASGGDDVAEQIRKLAALRDEGLLSSDEFDAKKRQLLGL